MLLHTVMDASCRASSSSSSSSSSNRFCQPEILKEWSGNPFPSSPSSYSVAFTWTRSRISNESVSLRGRNKNKRSHGSSSFVDRWHFSQNVVALGLVSETRYGDDAERWRSSGLGCDDRYRACAERYQSCEFYFEKLWLSEGRKRFLRQGNLASARRVRKLSNGGLTVVSCYVGNDSKDSLDPLDQEVMNVEEDMNDKPQDSSIENSGKNYAYLKEEGREVHEQSSTLSKEEHGIIACEAEVKAFQLSLESQYVSSDMQRLPNQEFLSNSLRFLFAAGGTGGHVFPAIAIADALKAYSSSSSSSSFISDIHFVGTKHRIESSVVPRSGYHFQTISAVSLRRPVFLSIQNLFLPFRLFLSLYQALQILRRFRPHAVVGTGGYVSFSVCIAAWLLGTPFIIQEQNAYPGLANRILSGFAKAIFAAFQASRIYFPHKKCIVSGNPVRASLRKLVPKTASLDYFFTNWRDTSDNIRSCETGLEKMSIDQLPEVVLIQGGSMGAKSINEAVSKFIEKMLKKQPHRFFIWQAGSKHYRALKEKFDDVRPRLCISEFIDDMRFAYSAADLVVATAGAITCSELLVVGKPSILIPLKYVVDDHQRKNAAVLAEAGACRVVNDDNSTSQQLEIAIDELLSDKQMLLRMHENALKTATTEASDLIAKEVFAIAKQHALKSC